MYFIVTDNHCIFPQFMTLTSGAQKAPLSSYTSGEAIKKKQSVDWDQSVITDQSAERLFHRRRPLPLRGTRQTFAALVSAPWVEFLAKMQRG